MELKSIERHGFYIKGTRDTLSDFAFLSLQIALKAYASTYHAFSEKEEGFQEILNLKGDTPKHDMYNHAYINAYGESIIHLHHFFELLMKDSLREHHVLLATDAQEKPLLLYKLLKNESITDDEIQNEKSIEFDRALKRILALIKANRIESEYVFLEGYKDFLQTLNVLRNRLLHRGTFVLSYWALDQLVIDFALPLIEEITRKKTFVRKMIPFKWRYKPTKFGHDPINELKKIDTRTIQGSKRAALLKEMMRAAYNNPLEIERQFDAEGYPTGLISVPYGSGLDNRHIKSRAEFLAKQILSGSQEYDYGNMVYKCVECPVCGVNSLLIFEDYDELDNKYNGKIKCVCCTFCKLPL